MIDGKSFIAIVTARGGSKGVPRKNIRELGGRPLIAHTFDQVRAVPEIDHTVLTTDDAEIITVADEIGFEIVERPPELATDGARSEPAVLHALDTAESRGHGLFDCLILLQPTSPFRTPETMRRAMWLLVESGASSLVTVRELNELIGTVENDRFTPLFPEDRKPRQYRRPKFALNGCIFACTTAHLRESGEFMSDDWACLEVNGDECLDIDEIEDFELAEYLIENKGEAKP